MAAPYEKSTAKQPPAPALPETVQQLFLDVQGLKKRPVDASSIVGSIDVQGSDVGVEKTDDNKLILSLPGLNIEGFSSKFLDEDGKAIPDIDGTYQLQVNPEALLASNGLLEYLKAALAGVTQLPTATELLIELIGQSNGDGQARASALPNGYTGQLANCYIYTPFSAGFALLQGGISSATAGGDNWGMEISMLPALVTQYNKRVNMAKYCMPGTQLAASGGQDWAPDATNEYYAASNANTAAARAGLSTHPVPSVIVWDQGESDANSTYASQYEANLTAFIAAKRSYYKTQVPFIIMQLSSGQTRLDAGPLTTVRQAQANVCQKVAGCYLIDSEGLELDGEKLHYVASALITRGQRVAAKIISILSGSAPAATLAPLVTVDDLANTLAVTHRYGVSETEAQVNNSGAWIAYTAIVGYNASTGKIDVGDVDRVAGYYKLRTRADSTTGRLASDTVSSAPFTTTAAAPDPDPTGAEELPSTDLASSAWNPTDATTLGGQPDGDGGNTAVLLRPGTSTANNRNLHTNDFPLAAGNHNVYVKGIPAGLDFLEVIFLKRSDFSVAASVLVNLATGTKVEGSTNATVAAQPGGAYRVKLPLSWSGGNIYVFLKPWATADRADYAADGVKGIKLYKVHLEAVS